MIHPTDVALAVLLGGALGAGLWCIAAAAPGWRAPTLVVRIAPYIRDVTDPAGTTLPETIADPTLALAGGMRTAWRRAQRRFAMIVGRSEAIELRLAQAGRGRDVAAFRGNQLAWALAGAAITTALVVLLVATDRFSAPALVLPAGGAVGGFIARDVVLASRARARVARIEEELPTVLEFLSLCLAAGEGILGSVRRVATVGSGELTAELRAVTIDVDTGTPLTDALTTTAHRLRAPVLTRAFDHVIAAIERGSPLADTLQAQAADARDDAKRRLIETAGRKEIFMLLPRASPKVSPTQRWATTSRPHIIAPPARLWASPRMCTRKSAALPCEDPHMPRRLVWSEVRDLLDLAACNSVDELIGALELYQADPPLPNEPVDE